MAKLIFIGDKFGGRVYDLAVEKITVGRGDHNTLTIPDASVSHTHCEILVYGTEIIVRDLGSRNGTFVHGARLQDQQKPLHDGQVVKFGSVEARLQVITAPDSNTVTDVTAVHAHARHVAEPHPSQPSPVPAPAVPAPAPSGEHTLLLPRPPAALPLPAATPYSTAGTPPSPGPRARRGIWLVLAVLAAVALVLVVIGALLGRR